MRSARVILATAAATAVIGLGAPAAFAAGSDWEKGDSSSSSSTKEESTTKEESGYLAKHPEDAGKSKGDWGGKPSGGVHTGGGALTAVNEGDWATAKDPKYDPETYKEKDSGSSTKEESGYLAKHPEDAGKSKGDWEKPSGGVHTGGGGLATPSVTTGGLAVLGVAAAGLYAARRKKTAGSVI
ncbi:hypothetical protein ACWD64_12145 [Streptomyces antibioticus]|uniref:hypothetical protein n=1 Tax=Streptomyces antibioticus TaxID=1890 RepID=UPI003F47F723